MCRCGRQQSTLLLLLLLLSVSVSAEQSCDQMFKHFEAARLREARGLYGL